MSESTSTLSVTPEGKAHCGARLRVLAVITETESVRRLLAHLGLPSAAPPLARARGPTDDAIDVTCED